MSVESKTVAGVVVYAPAPSTSMGSAMFAILVRCQMISYQTLEIGQVLMKIVRGSGEG